MSTNTRRVLNREHTGRSIRRLSAGAAALALAAMASSTMALVTEWSYSTDATFTDADFTGSVGTQIEDDYELSWGSFFGDFQNPVANNDFNRSALTIGSGPDGTRVGGGPATGTVTTVTDGSIEAGDFGLGINLTHWNNPIDGSFSELERGVIEDTLTLTPTSPAPGPSVNAPDITFTFNFAETSNSGGTDGSCADDTPTPCADIFGLFAIDPGDLNLAFDYDGQEYFASVLLTDEQGGASPIAQLGDEQCAEVDLDPGCRGFITAEAEATTVQFAFAVSTSELEFPASAAAPLYLLGFGLVGLGTMRRRARNA